MKIEIDIQCLTCNGDNLDFIGIYNEHANEYQCHDCKCVTIVGVGFAIGRAPVTMQ